MLIKSNYSLAKLHTFGFDISTTFFAEFRSLLGLKRILNSKEFLSSPKFLVIGGGSNLLFTGNYFGIILKNSTTGIKIIKKTQRFTYVRFAGGVNWDKACLWAVKHQLFGIENLSGIPGTVGASPVQNIGAYGVELKDYFFSLRYLNPKTQKIHRLNKKACEFGYRNSIFKNRLKGKTIILSVILKLKNQPNYQLTYPGLIQLASHPKLSANLVRKTILKIRKSKLPDPKYLGNAGSFFKNPIVSLSDFQKIKSLDPSMPSYPDKNGVKLNAAYFIEKCGFKGFRLRQVGVSEKHSLVLVNYGHGSPNDLINLSKKIIETVQEKYYVNLIPEVNIIS